MKTHEMQSRGPENGSARPQRRAAARMAAVTALLLATAAGGVVPAESRDGVEDPVGRAIDQAIVAASPDAGASAQAGTGSTSASGSNAGSQTPAATEASPPAPPSDDKQIAAIQAKFPALKLSRKDPKTIMVEDRFAVQGEGTEQSPYLVSWEHLLSASEVYDPRRGMKKLPDRVMFLDGAIVRLSGYIAFPLYVPEPKELLSMLNQWDGCCIGVPPTPYDAVEVRLKAAVPAEQRSATFGDVTGRFSVKPFLTGDWLVGLYVMEDGTLSMPKAVGAP